MGYRILWLPWWGGGRLSQSQATWPHCGQEICIESQEISVNIHVFVLVARQMKLSESYLFLQKINSLDMNLFLVEIIVFSLQAFFSGDDKLFLLWWIHLCTSLVVWCTHYIYPRIPRSHRKSWILYWRWQEMNKIVTAWGGASKTPLRNQGMTHFWPHIAIQHLLLSIFMGHMQEFSQKSKNLS